MMGNRLVRDRLHPLLDHPVRIMNAQKTRPQRSAVKNVLI